jgi:hypothetical protein
LNFEIPHLVIIPEISILDPLIPHYSYFNAVTGNRVAALRAGYSPESSPTRVAKARLNNGSQMGVELAPVGIVPPEDAAWLAR